MTVLKPEKSLNQLGEPLAEPQSQVSTGQPEPQTLPQQQEAGGRQLKLARLVSTVLHPFIVSPLAIILILWLDQGDLMMAVSWAALCAAFVILPGALYLRQKLKQKQFTDADVSVREERYGFYLFGALCMGICFAVLLWLDAPRILIASFTAALMAIILAAIVNRLWTKVSIHVGTMAAVAFMASFYSGGLGFSLALGALLISWARLVTKRHDLVQAMLGWLIAAICVVTVLGLLFNFS